jgi:tyrosinase
VTRIRKNVWSLPADDRTLEWYARAVASMKARPITDPTSWRYQAAIHGRLDEPGANPGDIDGEALPGDREQADFWQQCQHGSWYFLPWHRMYLHHFEKMVAAEVARLGGPADWALPYWNYSQGDDSRLLPPAFRAATLPDGTPNALRVEDRDADCNAGFQFADPDDVDLNPSMAETAFRGGPTGAGTGFGGPKTDFMHSGRAHGMLESVPHDLIHVKVNGWMGDPRTAALDPIFWVHHCNIDRLWDVWLGHNGSNSNPSTADWLKKVSFKFHDASGKVVSMTPDQVLDSTAAPLDYSYDDTSMGGAPVAAMAAPPTGVEPPAQPPEMVGATDAETVLDDAAAHTQMEVGRPSGPAFAVGAGEPPKEPGHVYLNIENITCDRRAGAYDVYVNVPAGTDPHQHRHLFVGRMGLFGVAQASQQSAQHAGSGLHYVFEITDLYRQLSAQPGWNPQQLRVSFVPSGKKHGAQVKVGRVSLYVA